MERDEERRQQLREEYEALSAEDKQRRLVLEPAFRDAYNEITQADRFSPVPWYFWAKWAPRLNPLLSMVYLKLRQFVFFNRQTGERREVVWPRQETLAEQIGSNRKSVMRALKELERLGFLSSKKGRFNVPKTGLLVNGTKKYRVFFELPLVPEDAVELLIRQMNLPENDQVDRMSLFGTFGSGSVENSHRESLLGTSLAVPNRDCRTNTRTNTPNVDNVMFHKKLKEDSPGIGEEVPRQRKLEKTAETERLAGEIGDALLTMEGSRNLEEHRSAGFHRVIASRMPETLLRKALMATRDAVDDQRAGRKTLRGGPSAYFAGVVKQLAADEGIELGLKAQVELESSVKGNQAPQNARGPRSGGHGRPEDEKEALEARAAVRALRERWAEE